jgi:predicted amidophosphoribosyltransferase
MPSVAELTAVYGNFLLAPRHGPGVCTICFNLTDGYRCCYACAHEEQWIDGFAPISYSVAHEQLHHALWGYKRLDGEVARRLTVELAAVLWRHLAAHEGCLARAAAVDGFQLVTTVPSGESERDANHPLRHIVADLVRPAATRHVRLLRRTELEVPAREFDPRRFAPTRSLNRESVLLIDDTWTTGASAQSAAAILKNAGAGKVGAVVIGRHVNRDWGENDRRLRAIPRPFEWGRCALCAQPRVQAGERTADLGSLRAG